MKQDSEGEAERLRRALELAAIRLEVCAGRMRGCHAETGQHGLLDEVETFVREARESLWSPNTT